MSPKENESPTEVNDDRGLRSTRSLKVFVCQMSADQLIPPKEFFIVEGARTNQVRRRSLLSSKERGLIESAKEVFVVEGVQSSFLRHCDIVVDVV